MENITTSLKNLDNLYLNNIDNIDIVQKKREFCLHVEDLFTPTTHYKSLQDIEYNLVTGRFDIDISNAHYECIFHKKQGKYLYVSFDGARKKRIPGFPRWSYHNLYDGSYLGIEDPMYYKYPTLKLGWYYGTNSVSYIADALLIVKSICRFLKIPYRNVIFFSSSGGGYASIYAASLIKNSLSIALNPQICLPYYTEKFVNEFTEITGISLNEYDNLNRNNLIAQIKNNKTSKHVILCNVQDTHHFENHILPLAESFSKPVKYGINNFDNVLLWIYSSVGAPSTHTSFETKTIYSIIDYIAKKFKKNIFTEEMQNVALITNELWNEVYIEKRKIFLDENNVKNINKYYVLDDKLYLKEDKSVSINTLDISIDRNEKKFNNFRIKLKNNTRNTIKITQDMVIVSPDIISLVLYDFNEKKTLYRIDKETNTDITINFIIGNYDNISFCIYAGLQGATQDNQLMLKIKYLSQEL